MAASPLTADPVVAALIQAAEMAQLGLILLDAAQRCRYANDTARALLGAGDEDLRGRDIMERFPERERAALVAGISAATTAPRRWSAVMRGVGEREPAVEFAAQPVAAQGIVAVTLRDVTERRLLTGHVTSLLGGATADRAGQVAMGSDGHVPVASASDSEQRYRRIFEAANDAMTITDENGYCVEANPAACRMYGYSFEEMIGRHAVEFTHPDYHHLARAFPEPVRSGGSIEVRAINLRKDGTPFYIEERASGVLYEGRPHILSVIRDITPQVRAEQQLRESEEQYHSIFEASSDGLIINDPTHGVVVEANPAVCRMHGYTREEFVGLHAYDFIHPDYHRVFDEFRQTIMAGGTYATQALDVRKDGTSFHVEVHGSSLMYRGRPHILAMVRDVSERVQARELLERRVDERTRELRSLLEVSSHVASTLELHPLLGLILDQLQTVIDHSDSSIYVVDGDALQLMECRMPPDQAPLTARTRVPLASSHIWRDALGQGEPVVVDDMHGDAPDAVRYRTAMSDTADAVMPPFRAYLAMPLSLKGHVIGALVITHHEPHYFTPARRVLVRAIADQAAVAIENARLYSQAQEIAALEERQRLARELHDSVSQALYGIALGARTARTVLDEDPAKVAAPLEYVLSLAEAGLAEMRALIFELLPEGLANEGLVAALGKQADAVRVRHGLAVDATLGAEPEVPLAIKEALYRIAQEALHNTVKHAHARAAALRLDVTPERLTLDVADDGAGFDTGGSFPGHIGLTTMRDRTVRLGGTFEIQSAAGAGTRIRVSIPNPRYGQAEL